MSGILELDQTVDCPNGHGWIASMSGPGMITRAVCPICGCVMEPVTPMSPWWARLDEWMHARLPSWTRPLWSPFCNWVDRKYR